ncbi:tripartite motif-containing protein 2-like [Ptychodera flava]|uniref:tripartite motif-containing protein 2-like n=1 Tax=Ptychodera flava TaxID=63121 RepID=UPI003969FDCD
MSLEEIQRAEGDNIAPAQPTVACKDHPENNVDFFCDTCKTPICKACTDVEHGEHEHRDIKEAAENIRRSLEDNLEKLQARAIEVTQSLVTLKTKTQEFDETYQREVSTVKRHALETEEGAAQEATLLQDLKASYEQSKVRMETMGTTLTQIKESAETTGVFVQNLLSHGNDVQLVSTAAEISTNLIDKVLTTAVPDVQDMCTLPSFLKKPLEVSGTLGTPNLHNFVQAIIPEDVKVKDNVKVTIKSGCSVASHSLKAEIITPDSGKTEMIPIVRPNLNEASDVIGVLSISFEKEGVFQLSVTLAGQPIRGSPYNISVKPHQMKSSPSQITVNPDLMRMFLSLLTQNSQWSQCKVMENGSDQFGLVCSVRIDSRGNVLMADQIHHVIYVLDKQWNFLKYLKFPFNGQKPFSPASIAVTNDDTYYISDGGLYDYSSGKCFLGGNNQIVVTNIEGELLDTLGQDQFGDPCCVSLSHNQKVLYVADGLHHCVYAISLPSNVISQKIGKRGSGPGELKHPCGVAVDSKGNLIVSEVGNKRVQLLTASGQYLHHFDIHGGRGVANPSSPAGILADEADNIYVCDIVNKRVLVYDEKGNFIDEILGLLNPINLCFVENMPYKMIVCDGKRLVAFKKK